MLIFAVSFYMICYKLNNYLNIVDMASLNQLVSEIVHSIGQPNNYALRNDVKSIVIHTRNELIRHSMEQHGYVDSVLQQRFKVTLQDVVDGEIDLNPDLPDSCKTFIKRTVQKVPRPTRFTNNLPFMRVSSIGYKRNQEIPYIKETSARFRSWLPGMRGCVCYDYINEYLYVFPTEVLPASPVENMKDIIIESVFEHPTEIKRINGEGAEYQLYDDDDEWLFPEDMIGQIKDIIMKRDLLSNHRETDEIPNSIKVN